VVWSVVLTEGLTPDSLKPDGLSLDGLKRLGTRGLGTAWNGLGRLGTAWDLTALFANGNGEELTYSLSVFSKREQTIRKSWRRIDLISTRPGGPDFFGNWCMMSGLLFWTEVERARIPQSSCRGGRLAAEAGNFVQRCFPSSLSQGV